MKTTLIKIVVAATLIPAMLGITGCYEPKSNFSANKTYAKIDASELYAREKNSLNNLYSSIDMNKLTPQEREFLKKGTREKIRSLGRTAEVWVYYKVVDQNDISPEDYIAMLRGHSD
jgi:hypothetical protein